MIASASRLEGLGITETLGNSQGIVGSVVGSNVEGVWFTGQGDFIGTGNALANELAGGTGDDTLSGLEGDDTLAGGLGDDVYVYRSGDGFDVIDDWYWLWVEDGYAGGVSGETDTLRQTCRALPLRRSALVWTTLSQGRLPRLSLS